MTTEFKPWKLKTLWLASALLAGSGCSGQPTPEESQPNAQVEQKAETQEEPGFQGKLSELPFVDPKEANRISVQQLKEPTALQENAVVHVKLAAPLNEKLNESLVRVVGQPESPQLLFRSDALAELGVISESPGPEFFSSFVNLPTSELEQRVKNEEELASLFRDDLTDRFTLFQGRRPIGTYGGVPFSLPGFVTGMPTPVNSCPQQPTSTFARWSESLLITHPAVVQDPQRTWDPCTGAGTQGGVWTFAHLMRQMATSSGTTPENFVTQWLSTWLNNQTINGDVVLARTQMFNQVIQPWATASGATATLVTNTAGVRSVTLSKPLNLNIAPFRLIAIVNRADLGKTARGPSGYGGATTDLPVDAGELRFVFGVTQPSPWGAGTEATCRLKPFTVIFEYGVPRTGCAAVVDWAKQWTRLNTFGGFTPAYRTHLQGLTQSVVLYNAAPTKGNRNAINQIRTNENALNATWELREFTLTVEPSNAPVSGLLRPHTVAQTPDDASYANIGDPTIDAFVMGPVRTGTPASAGPLPTNCSSNYTLPYSIFNWNAGTIKPFLGGNALIPPTHWRASSVAVGSPPRDVCARAQFSLNTCNGCHGADTSNLGAPAGNTAFVHVSPTSGIPAKLSLFLTGGGTGMMLNVPDTQLGSGRPNWRFADLDRRFRRLYNLAYCTNCNRVSIFTPALLDRVAEIAGAVPIDPIGPIAEQPKFQVGAIRDIESVKKILEVRPEFKAGFRDEPADFIRDVEVAVH